MYYSGRIGSETVKDFCSAGLLSDIHLVKLYTHPFLGD